MHTVLLKYAHIRFESFVDTLDDSSASTMCVWAIMCSPMESYSASMRLSAGCVWRGGVADLHSRSFTRVCTRCGYHYPQEMDLQEVANGSYRKAM